MAEVGGPGDGPIAEARRDNGSREMVSVGTAQCPHGARPSPPTPSSPRCHGHPAHDLAHEGGKAGGRCTSDSQGGQSAKSYRRVFCSDCRAPDGGARGGCITTALPSLPSVSVHPGAAHTDGGADDSAGKASSCRGGDPEEAKERVTVGGSLLLHTSVMDSIVKGALGMEGGAVLGGAENFKVSSSPVHVAGRFHSHAALSSGMRHRGVKQDSMTRRVYTSQSSASERAHRYHHTSRDAMPAQEDTPRLSPAPSSINIAKGTSRDRDDTVANVPEVVTGDTSGNRRDTSGMHNELHHVDSSSSVASQDCPGSTHVKPEKPLKAKRKKKLGSKKKLASGELPSEEGECDDTSSEHSVCFKPKKNKKRPRRHCDIHNPINKVPKEASCDAINSASCDGRSAVNINNQEAPREPQQTTTKGVQGRSDTKTLICTCGKGSKRPRSRVRPEPEGGSSQMPSHNGTYYDEFDKVIFSNEPIFSDMEFDAKEDAQIRTEMERYHKRSNHPDIFSAAQMVNTNTMLKFAIIGAELQNISGVSLRRAESEVGALTRRIRLLEEDFEQTENRLQDATSKLEEASKAADESERGRKVLERRNITDEERIGELEKELEETILAGEEADRKYEEAARKLAITEVDLERAEARLEAAEAKINELEEELKVVGNNMKSLEISEQEASQREDSYEESIRDLTARLKDAENRATEAERTVSKLQKEVDRLEDELLGEKEKYKSISEELDTTFAELAGF